MTASAHYPAPPVPVFLFDLDGTLIDSVYQHVIAWHAALSRLDIDLSVWRIHRRIGMSASATWPAEPSGQHQHRAGDLPQHRPAAQATRQFPLR